MTAPIPAPPSAHLHHVHIFASDIDATVAWYVEMLGAEVAYDGTFGGARNAFVHVGHGRLNIYDQPPRGESGGTYHLSLIHISEPTRPC